MATLSFKGRPSTGGDVQAASGDTLLLIAGVVMDLTLGMVKLPLQPYINNVQCGTTVTAANLNTLTANGDATALHTHASSSNQAGALIKTGQTVWATPVLGELGYISANNTWAKARANSVSTCEAAGAYLAAGTVAVGGCFSVFFDSALNSGSAPAAGQKFYVSATTAGRATNVSPNTTGQQEKELGYILDATGYDNTNGLALPIVWAPKTTIPL